MIDEIARLTKDARLAQVEGRADDARGLLRRAAGLGAEVGAHREAVGALRMLATMDLDLGRHDEGRALYDEAVALCRTSGNPTLLAHTVRHLGDVLRRASDLEGARVCYSEAIELYRASPQTHPSELANAVRPFAILEEALDNPQAARMFWIEAKALYERVGLREGVTECSDALERLGTA